MTELSIIIPCYNEELNIDLLFDKIKNLLDKNSNIEIIIVDNGSKDGTRKIFKIHNSLLITK